MLEIADFSQNKISESKFEIDKLRAELLEITKESYQSEDDQLRLLDSIQIMTKDVHQKTAEVNVTRKRIDILDSQNLAERKEIDYLETVLVEQKHTAHQNNLELERVREINTTFQDEIQEVSDKNSGLKKESKDADNQVKEASTKINDLEEKLCVAMEKERKVNK